MDLEKIRSSEKTESSKQNPSNYTGVCGITKSRERKAVLQTTRATALYPALPRVIS